MKFGSLRTGALCAMTFLVAACSSGSSNAQYTPPPVNQADYTKSLATYMGAAANNFQGFSVDTALVGSAECNLDNAGKDNATVECRLNTPGTLADATTLYKQQKGLLIKALPSNARGAEQTNPLPHTPFRYTAVSGKSGAVLVLTTQSGTDWYVGYVFQKVPG